MKVMITGGAGYIGSVLTRRLLDRGYEVTVLDRFFFGQETMPNHPRLSLIKGDIRWFEPKILEGMDAVMDLAALSNDPSGDLDPEKTFAINFKGRARVANIAKSKGVKRYILASTCSVYGFQDDIVNESSKTNPLTNYAKASELAEKEIAPLNESSFTTTFLRQATVYGLSPRMRFDLVVNTMAITALNKGYIFLGGGGVQWRPLVNVKDTSDAFIKVLEADRELVSGEIFNVGSNEQNYQMKTLGFEIADVAKNIFNKESFEVRSEGEPDPRSYKVDFSKIKNILGYKVNNTPVSATKEILEALIKKEVTETDKTYTVRWYKRLLNRQEPLDELLINGQVL